MVSRDRTAASTRYRLEAYCPMLEADGFVVDQVEFRGTGDVARLLNEARRADIVIVSRVRPAWPINQLLALAARRLVLDIDDAVFCRSDGSESATRARRFAAMVRHCDEVWAGNLYLSDYVQQIGGEAVLVPTSVDPMPYAIDATKPAQTIDLVWIGSKVTLPYLQQISDALVAAHRHDSRVRLKVIADESMHAGLPIEFVPWSETGEAEAVASSHIGIAPMPDNAWTRGKCGCKVLQYMAAGLPVIASRVPIHELIVLDGQSGLLVADDSNWVSAIVRLACDASLRDQLGRAGRARLAGRFTFEATYQTIRDRIEALLDG